VIGASAGYRSFAPHARTREARRTRHSSARPSLDASSGAHEADGRRRQWDAERGATSARSPRRLPADRPDNAGKLTAPSVSDPLPSGAESHGPRRDRTCDPLTKSPAKTATATETHRQLPRISEGSRCVLGRCRQGSATVHGQNTDSRRPRSPHLRKWVTTRVCGLDARASDANVGRTPAVPTVLAFGSEESPLRYPSVTSARSSVTGTPAAGGAEPRGGGRVRQALPARL
jgi:hypothetical protein